MARKRQRSEIETLKGVIRKQRAEIKQLVEQIESLTGSLEDSESSISLDIDREKCPDCQEYTLKKRIVDALVHSYCDECNYSKFKLNEKK